MTRFLRSLTGWLGRHALACVAAAVVAVGAAGGGVTYALASHGTASGASAAATSPLPSPAGGAHLGRGAAGHGALAEIIALLTRDTGQSLASIRAQLQAGKSLNQIAGAKAAQFENDVLAQLTTRADKAVAAKRITAAQEAAGLAKAKTFLDKAMAEPGTTLLQQLGHLGAHLHHSRPSPTAAAPAA